MTLIKRLRNLKYAIDTVEDCLEMYGKQKGECKHQQKIREICSRYRPGQAFLVGNGDSDRYHALVAKCKKKCGNKETDDYKDICPFCEGDKTVANCNHSEVKPLEETEECEHKSTMGPPYKCYDCGRDVELASTPKPKCKKCNDGEGICLWCNKCTPTPKPTEECEPPKSYKCPNDICDGRCELKGEPCFICDPTPKTKHEPKNSGCDGCIADTLNNPMTAEYTKPTRLEDVREEQKQRIMQTTGDYSEHIKDVAYLLALIDKKNTELKDIKAINECRERTDKTLRSVIEKQKKKLDKKNNLITSLKTEIEVLDEKIGTKIPEDPKLDELRAKPLGELDEYDISYLFDIINDL